MTIREESTDTAAAMLRAGQLTEAGGWICANLAGGYELLEKLYDAMDEAKGRGEGGKEAYIVRLWHSEDESTEVAAAMGPGAANVAYRYAGQYVDEGIRVDVVKQTEEILFSLERGGIQ